MILDSHSVVVYLEYPNMAENCDINEPLGQ